jgi:hypothetical protein
VVPAIALLIPLMVESLLQRRQFRSVVLLCVASVGGYLLWQAWVVSHTVEGLVLQVRLSEHAHLFAFLAITAIFVIALALWYLIDSYPKTTASTVLMLTSVALLLIYVHTNISEDWNDPLQFNGLSDTAQQPLRQTGADLSQVVGKNALVIVALDDRQLQDSLSGFFACGPGPEECVRRLAYLYLMYWSDADVLDVCRDSNPQNAMERFREWNNAYLVTNRPLPASPLTSSPIGYVYSLRGISFDVWGPAATQACSVPPMESAKRPGSTRVAGNLP